MINRPEAEIMKRWPAADAPMVTVVAVCYCHAKYLSAALDSVLAQETDFPFEVLVHDDASPDGSAALIREYAARYPRIIRPVLEEENQLRHGIQALLRAVRPGIRGKYIAYLDCDDFWTDSHKLQRQADFLEAHPAYLAVAHNCTVVDENGDATGEPYPECHDEEYTMEHFLHNTLPGQFATLLTRDIFTRNAADHPLLMTAPQGPFDRVLALTLLLNGRVFCLQKSMSAYRHVTSGGASYSATYRFDIRREARFYLSFVLQCKRMGRTGDAVGMLRWLADFLAHFTVNGYVSGEESAPYLAFCRSGMASLSDRLRGERKRCPCCAQEVQYVPLPIEEQEALFMDGPLLPETMNADEYRCPCCGSTDGQRLLAAAVERFGIAQKGGDRQILCVSSAEAPRPCLPGVDCEFCGPDTSHLPDGCCDLVLWADVLERSGDGGKALAELRRILKPRGAALLLADVDLSLSDADDAPEAHGGAVRPYSRRGLTALLERHFAARPLGRDDFGHDCFAQAGLTETATVYLLTHPGVSAAFTEAPEEPHEAASPGPDAGAPAPALAETERDELAAERDELAAERDELARRLAAAQHGYDVISNATLWRATKPLRVVLDGLKKLLGRDG